MIDVVSISEKNLQAAQKIIQKLKINEIWTKYNSQANLVGSIKTKLLMEHLDIDFHIYSQSFSITDSFSAVGCIAECPGIEKIHYINNIEKEDQCIEWHLEYVDIDERKWQIDLIHIMNESPYAGKFERVAEKINEVMTDEIRKTILRIKWELGNHHKKAMGIEIYKAVIEDKVSTYQEFLYWKQSNPPEALILWEPTLESKE